MDEKRSFGCGYDENAGCSEVTYSQGASDPPYNKTCPRYYYVQPAIQEILSDVKDYERGALGDVRLLEACYLEYLKTAASEIRAWEDTNFAQLRSKQ